MDVSFLLSLLLSFFLSFFPSFLLSYPPFFLFACFPPCFPSFFLQHFPERLHILDAFSATRTNYIIFLCSEWSQMEESHNQVNYLIKKQKEYLSVFTFPMSTQITGVSH